MNDNLVTPTPDVKPIEPVADPTPVTPVEPVTPPVPEPTKLDTTEIEKNLESSISEKVSKSVITKIGEALGLTKKEEETLPTDPKELLEKVREESKKATNEVLSEKEKASEE